MHAHRRLPCLISTEVNGMSKIGMGWDGWGKERVGWVGWVGNKEGVAWMGWAEGGVVGVYVWGLVG